VVVCGRKEVRSVHGFVQSRVVGLDENIRVCSVVLVWRAVRGFGSGIRRKERRWVGVWFGGEWLGYVRNARPVLGTVDKFRK